MVRMCSQCRLCKNLTSSWFLLLSVKCSLARMLCSLAKNASNFANWGRGHDDFFVVIPRELCNLLIANTTILVSLRSLFYKFVQHPFKALRSLLLPLLMASSQILWRFHPSCLNETKCTAGANLRVLPGPVVTFDIMKMRSYLVQTLLPALANHPVSTVRIPVLKTDPVALPIDP